MKIHLALVVFSLIPVTCGALAAAPDDDHPVELRVNAAFVEPNLWQGLVGGPFTGAVRAVMQRSLKKGAIWDMNCTWIVDAGRLSFVARLSGTYSTETGKAVMNGVVTDGFRRGDGAHLRAQLVYRFSKTYTY